MPWWRPVLSPGLTYPVNRLLPYLLLIVALLAAPLHAATSAAEPGTFWVQRSQPTEFQHFFSICSNGEVFVTAGYSPAINGNQFLSVSRDGRKWTIAKQAGNSFLTGLDYGNGRFVAVGWRGEILTSTNGTDWTRPASPTTKDLLAVTCTGTGWVACGEEGTLIHSQDGVTWSAVSAGLTSSDWLYHLGVAGETTLAMGNGFLLRSDDGGASWSRVSGAPAALFNCAVKVPAGIVLWWNDGYFLWDGGSNWQEQAPDAVSGNLYGGVERVRSNGTHYLAFTSRGEMAASPDGLKWFKLEIPPQDGGAADAVATADGWLIVRRDGQVLEARPGASWSAASSNASPVDSVQTVIRHGGQFLAFGSYGSRFQSANGIQWTSSSGGSPWLRRAAASRGTTVVVVGRGDRMHVEHADGGAHPLVGAGTDLFGVAASPSAFVAVGKDGRILRSPDGLTWAEMSSGTTELLTAVTWDGTRFRAVGKNGLYLHSADGTTWQHGSLPGTPFLRAIAATSHGLVAVGHRGAIFVSANGTNWTDRSVDTPADFQTVVETGNGILALGKHAASAWSADGQQWTAGPQLDDGGTDISSAIYHEGQVVAGCGMGHDFETGNSSNSYGKFIHSRFPYAFDLLLDPKPRLNTLTRRGDGRIIAGGDNGTIWTSADGIEWDRRRLTNWRLADSETAGETTVFAGTGGMLWTADGEEWEFASYTTSSGVTTGSYFDRYHSLAHGGGRWVAVGSSGRMLVSDDGRVWRRPVSLSGMNSNDFFRIEYGGGRFVAVGANKSVRVSTDGETWVAPVLPATSEFWEVCWTGSEFRIPVYPWNTILVSPDGLNWSTRAATPGPDPSSSGRYVSVDGRVYVLAFAERISSTVDQLAWTRHSSHVGDTSSSAVRERQVLDLLKAGDRFVAVGTEGLVMTSEDGQQWTYRNGGMVGNLTSVQWLKDRFFVTGNYGGLFSSPDGGTWTKHNTGGISAALTAAAWNGTRGVAVGQGVAYHSDDLWNWTATTIPGEAWPADVIWAGDRFMTVSRDYRAGISPDGINWTFASAPMNHSYQVAWNGTYALAGPYRSTDGLDWTRFYDDWADGGPIWDGAKFIYTGGTFVGISPDGLSGYRVLDGPLYVSLAIHTPHGYFGLIREMAYSQPCRSADGIHWETFGERLPDRITGFAWSGHQLMAVGEGGEVYTSTQVDSLPFYTQLIAAGHSTEGDLTLEGDANGDGISNAVAYYFGMPLDGPGSAAERGRLPVLRKTEGGGSELVFRLSAEEAPYFLDLAIERSGDLGNWQEMAIRSAGGIWSDPAVGEITDGGFREVTLPVEVTEDPGFWRVKVGVRD